MKPILAFTALISSLIPLGICGYSYYLLINMQAKAGYGIFKTLLLFAAWFTGMFFAAFFSGLFVRIFNRNKTTALITAGCWIVFIIAAAIYPWLTGNFSTVNIIQHIILDVILFLAGVWVFLMVSMIGALKN